jgi:hypothetical protein
MPFKPSRIILSIFIFLVQAALGYFLYEMFTKLRDGRQVTSEDIFLFNIWLVSFSVISIALCIWGLRMQTHGIIKLLGLLAALAIVLLAFNLHYKSMHWPYEIRLLLVNGSGKTVKDLRLSGCMDLDIDSIGVNKSGFFQLPVTENCKVWLVNKKDSVMIISTSTNRTGYNTSYTIK